MRLIEDISLVQDLALAIGTSFSVQENCSTFLNVLVEQLELNFAAIWIKQGVFEEEKQSEYQLIYALPESKIIASSIPTNHPIPTLLAEGNDFLVRTNTTADFESFVEEKDFTDGFYLIFKLSDLGFLKMHAPSNSFALETLDFNQMIPIVHRFAISLKTGIAYEQLKNERSIRRNAQELLKQSTEEYQDLFENTHDAIIFHDKHGNITNYNKEARKMLGLKPSTQSEKINILDYILPEEYDRVMNFYQTRVKNGMVSDFELRVKTYDGILKYIRVNSNAFYVDGEYAGARDLIRDITEQKMAAQAIRNNELKYRQIIDTSLDSIIVINEEGRVTEWNDFAVETFGYTKEEVKDKFVWNTIIPHRFRKAYFKEMEHYWNTGSSPVINNRFEISALRKSGEEFPIELSVTPIQIDDKHFFSLFIRDITTRKKVKDDLLKAKHTAEQARLAEQQFLANMSHEIRTPMNAVIGMTHLLYETEPTPVQSEYLDALKFSGDSLLGIINNILDLSKIGAGELEFEKRAFNLEELLRSLQVSFQFKVKEKPISVVMDLDYKIENMVMGDPTKLNQILTNLLGNASKFTHHGTIGLSALLLEEENNIYNIEFVVHDTGIGIEEKKIKTIFDSFKQADAAVTRKYGGTGLGLSIVKQLVEMQGGSISVESTLGKGSIFKFNLPLENSGEKAVDQSEKLEITQQEVDKALEDVSILIVEDNFMNQKLITKILDIWNCKYHIAKNGLEGVNLCEANKYDIILMDVHMPEMDGCEATINIRANKENPNNEVPIIALTAAALLDEKKRVFESGMDDFLTKPFSPNVLKGLLRKWLNLDEKIYAKVNSNKAPKEQSSKTDFSYLSEFSGGDEGFIIEMIETFLIETPTALEQIKTAFADNNFSNLHDHAHRMKPTLMMMGMSAQEKKAETIERMAKSGDFKLDNMRQIINELYVEVCEVLPELRSKLMQLKRVSL